MNVKWKIVSLRFQQYAYKSLASEAVPHRAALDR